MGMKKKALLKRYHTDKGRYVVNISINSFEDLFNKFDKTSSFKKMDLNVEFAEYLHECAEEIGNHPFFIRLDILSGKQSPVFEEKVETSIDNYFEHLIRSSERRISKLLGQSVIHFFLSLVFITLSFLFTTFIKTDSAIFNLVFESINIAAWVLMWPVFSDFFYLIRQEVSDKKVYRNIVDVDTEFCYRNVSSDLIE